MTTNERGQPLHEMLRAHARRRPGHPAYVWYGAELSYGELDRASDAFAARLAQLGVARGEPVALYLQNCPQYVIAHYAIQKIGAIVSPCGPLSREHELQYQLDDLKARVLVVAAPLLDVVAKVRARTALEHVFVVHYDDLLPQVSSFDVPEELRTMRRLRREGTAPIAEAGELEDFLAATRTGAAAPRVDVGLDEIALITYTSGTTGLPKGAMLTHGNARYKTAVSSDGYRVSPDDVLLAVAPVYHIAGMLTGVDIPVYAGATAVLLYRFDARTVMEAIETHGVSWWYSIAPMNVAAMQLPDAQEFDLSSLRINPVTSFGITFTETIARRWREYAPNCVSFEAAYGLSETHTMDTYMPADAIRWGTHGKPVPGNEIRIVDPATGEPRRTGASGEILIRGPGVFRGYRNRPDATDHALRDGWLHTGDIGHLDDDGYLTFEGRFKEMIKVSGYSVFPEEVESILVRHPAIAQAGVIGMPDPEKGEIPKAFVVLKAGASGTVTESQIVQWARANMAVYKAPREVVFCESLPATGSGKMLRRLLKDL